MILISCCDDFLYTVGVWWSLNIHLCEGVEVAVGLVCGCTHFSMGEGVICVFE
jgi:hypothetical protein